MRDKDRFTPALAASPLSAAVAERPQADVEHEIANKKTWLPRGTFALQAHPPAPGQISKAYFKNVCVKVLPD